MSEPDEPVSPWSSVLWSETGSETDEAACWRTPPEVFRPLHREFRFALDAAARVGSPVVPFWLGPDHPNPSRRDAFEVDWSMARPPGSSGAVWLNPPYGRGMGRWMRLARRWSEAGLVVVALILARTETPWWHSEVMPFASEVRFVRRRVRFLRPDGEPGSSAPAPSIVIVWRPERRGPPACSTFEQTRPVRIER